MDPLSAITKYAYGLVYSEKTRDARMFQAQTSVVEEERASTRRFDSTTTALEVVDEMDLTGKTIIITGCNFGIGVETARALALKGAHVVMLCRNLNATEMVKRNILNERSDAQIDVIHCDLTYLASVKQAAKTFLEKDWPLDVLILNAGISWSSARETKDGHESTFGVNHLAHFYLTKLLLPKLRESGSARVVIVSSLSHKLCNNLPQGQDEGEYIDNNLIPKSSEMKDTVQGVAYYASSKMCNVLFAYALSRKEEGIISANALHPGSKMCTEITLHMCPKLREDFLEDVLRVRCCINKMNVVADLKETTIYQNSKSGYKILLKRENKGFILEEQSPKFDQTKTIWLENVNQLDQLLKNVETMISWDICSSCSELSNTSDMESEDDDF